MTLSHVYILLFIFANLLAAVMFGCMVQSTFEKSTTGFRLVVGFLAIACLACCFVGVDGAGAVATGRLAEPTLAQWVATLQAMLLATFLLLMRLEQIRRGTAEHSKQREARMLRAWRGGTNRTWARGL